MTRNGTTRVPDMGPAFDQKWDHLVATCGTTYSREMGPTEVTVLRPPSMQTEGQYGISGGSYD
jgi:hypothetical protein